MSELVRFLICSNTYKLSKRFNVREGDYCVVLSMCRIIKTNFLQVLKQPLRACLKNLSYNNSVSS